MAGPVQFSFANSEGGPPPGAVSVSVDGALAEQPRQLHKALNKTKVAPKNIVALAKARLREVKVELRKLKALEKEKGELERLIFAAENKPQKSNLREIKRSAG